MVRPTLVYIVSDTEKSLEFEWVAEYFVKRAHLYFILIGKKETPLATYLTSKRVTCEFVTDANEPSTFIKVWSVFWILKKIKPSVVHCHLWRASLIGLTAAFLARIKKRVFTRHHSMIHYVEFKSGRKWDRLCNWLATDIIAISENVKEVLLQFDKADKNKVHVIHHGFDLSYFANVNDERTFRLKTKYNINTPGPVVGVISRYLELKGIQYIIPAFLKLRETFPTAHLVLANARGAYQSAIQELLQKLPTSIYTEIIFEDDLATLYSIFDVFVHVPVDARQEAFGQTYVEALASGIPAVFTLSGVAPEFVEDGVNALVVNYKSVDDIASSIIRILKDDELKNKLIREGKSSVKRFELSSMLNKLERLYA